MTKVTKKLQITIPAALAADYGIRPGMDVKIEPAGEFIQIRVVRSLQEAELNAAKEKVISLQEIFARHDKRIRLTSPKSTKGSDRDWKRDNLYDRT